MHLPLMPSGDDIAAVATSIQPLATKILTTADTRSSVTALLLQPVWRAEHLKVLRVKERSEVTTAIIVGKFNLPRNGQDDFEELSSDLLQPTTTDLLNFSAMKDAFRLNVFWPLFSSLYEMSGFESGSISQNRYVRTAQSAVRCLIETIMPYADQEGSLRIDMNSVPFHLKQIAVKGVLSCDGCIIKTDVHGCLSPLPVAAFSVMRPKDKEDIEAQEASQLVLEAALAYEQNQRSAFHKVFAIHVIGTTLQIASADIPRLYLEKLYQGNASPEGFEVSHSQAFELLEVNGRREALRAMFGLLKALGSRPARNFVY